MAGFFRRTRGGEYTAPKTVLGFYAGVLVIMEAAVLSALAVIATKDSLDYLVPWVLGFGGLVMIALITVVVVINVTDPTKLQLGQITGREFLDYQRVTRGDSIGGEYIDAAAPTTLPTVIEGQAATPGLNKPGPRDDEERGQ